MLEHADNTGHGLEVGCEQRLDRIQIEAISRWGTFPFRILVGTDSVATNREIVVQLHVGRSRGGEGQEAGRPACQSKGLLDHECSRFDCGFVLVGTTTVTGRESTTLRATVLPAPFQAGDLFSWIRRNP